MRQGNGHGGVEEHGESKKAYPPRVFADAHRLRDDHKSGHANLKLQGDPVSGRRAH